MGFISRTDKTLLFYVIFCFVFSIYKECTCKTTYCFGRPFNGRESNISTECVNDFYNEVCLVCNVSPSSRNIAWFGNNECLAMSHFKIDEDHPGDLSLKQCVEDRYTLSITKPTDYNYGILYHCRQSNETISVFELKLKTSLSLFLETTLTSNGTLISRKSDTIATLQCLVGKAIPPFMLTWSVNGYQEKKKSFNYMANASSSYRDNFNVSVNGPQVHEISCTVEGQYISWNRIYLRISTEKDKNDKGDDKSDPKHNYLAKKVYWIPFTCLSVAVLLLTTYFVLSGHIRNKEENRTVDVDTAFSNTTNRRGQDLDCGSYGQTGDDIEIENYYEGNFSFSKTLLTRMISSNGLYEYWYGSYNTDDSGDETCVVKILSDLATHQDVSEFKMLASKLNDMLSSPYVVKILCCNTEERPYRIMYELMETGPLKEYLIQRSEKSLDMCSRVHNENAEARLKELLLFASDIANAMCFLISRDFCHPVLSLKKVLLTPKKRCKLYDIYPSDLAMMKVKVVMKKINPPLAWMPPEMLMWKKHLLGSDVWSFGVLLWELFSFGKTPLAEFAASDIETKISKDFVLEQPSFCPRDVYDIMVMSWVNKSGGRPSFRKVHLELQNTLKAFENEGKSSACSSEERFYFVLDTQH